LAAGFKGGRLRSSLVVFQFSISIFLIIGTLVIYNQLKYIQHKDLGYDRDHVLIVKNVEALGNSAKNFKQEIKRLPGIENATLSGSLPTYDYDNSTAYFKDPILDQKKAILTQQWNVDEDYINTLKIKMVAGRAFSKDMPTDSAAIVINESFAKLLNFSNPIGQFLYTPAGMSTKAMNKYKIIGIMKDFNFKSLRENITPILFNLSEDRGALNIRITSTNIPSLMARVENKWREFSPNRQFSYSFMDQEFDTLYRLEQRMGGVFISFTFLAITIACLGLFGLAAYAAEQRTREIGIRKVLGAGVSTIVNLLSGDFIKLVFIAIAIATPLAWWAMHGWLQGFAYRQNIQWWVPAVAALLATFIAIGTISFHSIKAALRSPVESLKSE
jgi:putative ABC transport system permease protein